MFRFSAAGLILCAVVCMLAAPDAEAAGPPFLYAASGSSSTLMTYAADGTPGNFGPYLITPIGLSFDRSGNLYYADSYDGVIGKITPSGAFSVFATGLHAPDATAFDAAGNLYVSNGFGINTIAKITPAGTVSTFATLSARAAGLAFDSSGNLYAANVENNEIDKITPSGTVSTFATGLNGVSDIAFDASGNMYECNAGQFEQANGSVDEFSPNGTVIRVVASGLNGPLTLAFDNANNLYVGEDVDPDGFIYKITPTGTISNFVTNFSSPFGSIAIAPAYALNLPVPEPASLVLLAPAISILMLRARDATPEARRSE